VIPCGVELAEFGPGERARGQVVCVGSLQDYKGQRYLIDAVQQLRAAGRELSLVLVGEGELRSELGAQVDRLGLRSVVEFAGHEPTARISELLATATVVVQPSVVTASGKMEGVPVALMEALASEAAVVATDISGVSELVVDGVTGLLIPQRDAVALADAMATLLDDAGLRARLGRAGRDHVARSYDLEQNAAAFVRVLTATRTGADEGTEAVIEGASS
jgi:glycosyltransferase involved in cell wall biosynthesis